MDPSYHRTLIHRNDSIFLAQESNDAPEETGNLSGHAVVPIPSSTAIKPEDRDLPGMHDHFYLKRFQPADPADRHLSKRIKLTCPPYKQLDFKEFLYEQMPLPDKLDVIESLKDHLDTVKHLERNTLQNFDRDLEFAPVDQILLYHKVLLDKCSNLINGCQNGSDVPIGQFISTTKECHDLLLLFLSEKPVADFSGKLFEKIMCLPPAVLPFNHPLRMMLIHSCQDSLQMNSSAAWPLFTCNLSQTLRTAIADPSVDLQYIVRILDGLSSEHELYKIKISLIGFLYHTRGINSKEGLEATFNLLFEPDDDCPPITFFLIFPIAFSLVRELSKDHLDKVVCFMCRKMPSRGQTVLSSIQNLIHSLPWLVDLSSTAEGLEAVGKLLSDAGRQECLAYFLQAESKVDLIKSLIQKYGLLDPNSLYGLLKLQMPFEELDELEWWFLQQSEQNGYNNFQLLCNVNVPDPFLVRYFAAWWDFVSQHNNFHQGLLPSSEFFIKWTQLLLTSQIPPHKALVFAHRAIEWRIFPEDHPFLPCAHAIRNAYLLNPEGLGRKHIEE